MNILFKVLATIILVGAVALVFSGCALQGAIVALIGCALCLGEIRIRDRRPR